MSVYKHQKSKLWHYDFTIKGRRFFGSTGVREKSTAQRIENAVRVKAATGDLDRERAQMTLDNAAGLYFDQVAQWQTSAVNTEYMTENILRLLGKNTLLTEIAGKLPEAIARRRGERKRQAPKAHAKNCICQKCRISPASVNREVELLRRIMNRARKVYKVATDSIDWADYLLREADPPTRSLSIALEAKLLEACAPHLRPIIEVALMTGLRLNNVVGLQWEQIDLEAGELTVRLKSKHPGGREHTLPINDRLKLVFLRLEPQKAGAVFTYKGKPLKSVKTAWKAAKRRAGVPANFRFHDLRHTVGSRLADAGGDIDVIADYLGHADFSTTKRYVHRKKSAKLEAMNTIAPPVTAKRRKAGS